MHAQKALSIGAVDEWQLVLLTTQSNQLPCLVLMPARINTVCVYFRHPSKHSTYTCLLKPYNKPHIDGHYCIILLLLYK